MKLEVLMSCMHQTDDTLVQKSNLTGDVVVINQCDLEDYREYPTPGGTARIFSTTGRGLTKSRNMAIGHARGDICVLCDDDEVFFPDYEGRILDAYRQLPQADVVVFRIANWKNSLGDEPRQLRFPQTMKVSSIQISFRRQSLVDTGVRFDELLGAGSGNGAEEELKFLWDCQKAGLHIHYVPVEIASLETEESTWFGGFTETFFENRGATTRYIMGAGLASLYAVYYIVRKRSLYGQSISPARALGATFRGIRKNPIAKLARKE